MGAVKEENIPILRFSEFKDNWLLKPLKSVSTINPKSEELPIQFTYIDLESVKNGILEKQEVIEKEGAPSRAQRLLKKNDVLFQMVRPYQKNNFFFDRNGDYVASTGYAQIRAKYDAKYLFQFLHTEKFVRKVILRCTGTSYPAINSTDLATIKINLPSLPEQTKIANFLTSVDEKINLLIEKKEALEEYKKGMMQKIFSQEIRFKDDNGEDFEDWEEKRLGDCLDYEQPTNYIVKSTEYNNSYNTAVLTAGKTFILGYTNEEFGIYKNYPIIIFDDFTTTSKYVNFQFKVKSSAIKILKSKGENDVKFLYERMQMINFELGGHGRHWISVFSQFELSIPCIEEQTKIANFLSAIDEKIELVNTQIKEIKEYKKGLLQGMFC